MTYKKTIKRYAINYNKYKLRFKIFMLHRKIKTYLLDLISNTYVTYIFFVIFFCRKKAAYFSSIQKCQTFNVLQDDKKITLKKKTCGWQF